MPVGLYRSRRQKDCMCPPALQCSEGAATKPASKRGKEIGFFCSLLFSFFLFFPLQPGLCWPAPCLQAQELGTACGGPAWQGAATPSPEHSPKSPGIPKVCCSAQRAEASLFSSPFLLWPQKKRKKKRGTNPAWYCRANHFGSALKALTAQLKKHNTSSQRRWVFFPHKTIR